MLGIVSAQAKYGANRQRILMSPKRDRMHESAENIGINRQFRNTFRRRARGHNRFIFVSDYHYIVRRS
jgi:hypothetical protein